MIGYYLFSGREKEISPSEGDLHNDRKEGKDLGLRKWLFGKTSSESSGYELMNKYEDIRRSLDIYNGGGDWRYTRKGGINGGTRRVASLGAAKAVCAELTRLCCAEGSAICSTDSDTERFVSKVLAENCFNERFPAFLEKMFALGGGVIKVYWDKGVKLDFITADCFVPTKWDGRGVYGGAFASRVTTGGKSYILAETQELIGDDLVVQNRLYNDMGGAAKLSDVMPELSEKSTIKGIGRTLFVYFGVRTNNDPQCSLLGSSVYAGAEDTLKNLDMVFDSLGREFVLGKKRIIVPYYAVRGEYDENGDIRRYFDVNDEVFQAMSVSDAEELKISDNTAELRVTEHNDALSSLLDLLCMQVGLSEGALSYKDGTIKTATEVVSRNSRTYRTQTFYRRIISAALERVAENICILGKMSGELSDEASEKVSIVFADGAAEDDSTRIDRAVALYGAGLISRARAISQIYGIPLEEAKTMERTDFYEQ